MGRPLHTLRSAILKPQKLAKSNVQTSPCDQREPANASSLYLAVLIGRRLNRSPVTVRILHVSSMMCSRPISGSLLLWRISGGGSSFLGKSQ